jgi:hypothetical protein
MTSHKEKLSEIEKNIEEKEVHLRKLEKQITEKEKALEKIKNTEEELKIRDKQIETLKAVLEDNNKKIKYLLEEERKDKVTIKNLSKVNEELMKRNNSLSQGKDTTEGGPRTPGILSPAREKSPRSSSRMDDEFIEATQIHNLNNKIESKDKEISYLQDVISEMKTKNAEITKEGNKEVKIDQIKHTTEYKIEVKNEFVIEPSINTKKLEEEMKNKILEQDQEITEIKLICHLKDKEISSLQEEKKQLEKRSQNMKKSIEELNNNFEHEIKLKFESKDNKLKIVLKKLKESEFKVDTLIKENSKVSYIHY